MLFLFAFPWLNAIQAVRHSHTKSFLDLNNHPKSLGHVLLTRLLLKKLTHCNDVGDIVFVVPSSEGGHLVICPVRKLYLDLGLFLLLIEVCRLNLRDPGPIDNVPPFTLRVLDSLRHAF